MGSEDVAAAVVVAADSVAVVVAVDSVVVPAGGEGALRDPLMS